MSHPADNYCCSYCGEKTDNIFGIILLLFLCGPLTWVVMTISAVIYGLLTALKLKQIDEAVKALFRR